MSKNWLRTQAQRARPWPRLALAAGVVQGIALILQAAVLALLFQGLIQDRRPFGDLRMLWFLFPALVGIRALAGWAREEAGQRASRALRLSLRLELLDQIRRLGPAWRSSQQGGDLSSRLLEQVDALDGYVARFVPQQALAALVPMLILLVTFPLNWAVGLVFVATAPLIPLFMALVGWGAKDKQDQQFKTLSRMSARFLDLVRGLGTLRLLNAHRRQEDSVKQNAEDFRVKTMGVLRLAFLSSTVLEFFSAVAIALTAVYLGFHLLGDLNFGSWGTLNLGIGLFLLFLAPEFYLPLRELGASYHARAEALAAADQLRSLLEAPPVGVEGGTLRPGASAPAIEFRGLWFRYRDAVPVLQALNLTLRSGECVGLTGKSGAGKTSLLRLLLGQMRPDEGSILIDGQPLHTYDLAAWHENVSLMSQHPRLLSGTLADNLRVANQGCDEAAMHRALEFAGLGPWFENLGSGLSTLLGEGGRLLSGGELRRLALARISLRPSKLLLLDEPTASLDSITEGLLIRRLGELRKGRTTLILTHREAILSLADRMVVLEGA